MFQNQAKKIKIAEEKQFGSKFRHFSRRPDYSALQFWFLHIKFAALCNPGLHRSGGGRARGAREEALREIVEGGPQHRPCAGCDHAGSKCGRATSTTYSLLANFYLNCGDS